MAPKFGTSGLRGLVSELTETVIETHVKAFLATCETGNTICLGQDLRPSSPRIAADIARAAQAAGADVIDCGEIATPALALAAARHKAGAVMVTGSHIPADRNGLKFYVQYGLEITKADEARIQTALGQQSGQGITTGTQCSDHEATRRFVGRYLTAFGSSALHGRRIGVYEHSAVGRDALVDILRGLGAEVIPIARSETFIPVDTEAVDQATRTRISDWVARDALDALVSTDGDSDRPLLADETGRVIPGDILGQITAQYLKAETVVTPVSSNSGVTEKGFAKVVRTRIGSPFVIAEMATGGRVVGYEANGGFLLGFGAEGPAGPLPPLMTRDCMLPLIAMMIAAAGAPISARVAQEPAVVTVADRLQDIPSNRSQALVAHLTQNDTARAEFLAPLGTETRLPDLTDGLRMHLSEDRILHVRPSGNAPELRLYVEARSETAAETVRRDGLSCLRRALKAF